MALSTKIDEHLLDLDPVPDYCSGCRCRSDVECHAAPLRFAANDRLQIAQESVEFDRFPFIFILAEQFPKAMDHFAGTQVVAADVGENPAQFVASIGAGLEDEVRGVRIAQDCAERLVDLVRDGARQFPSHRKA